jgi:hypothetical protein
MLISLQHAPSQASAQPHRLSGQPHRPPQHSSFGKCTRPKATALSSDSHAESGYTVISIGSKCTPPPFRRGGGGNAAAWAKKRSSILIESGFCEPGNTTVRSSIHVPHPSAQFLRLVKAFSGPRCSKHPGQPQRRPHVQPEPAMEAMVLRGGMTGKSSTPEGAGGLSREI